MAQVVLVQNSTIIPDGLWSIVDGHAPPIPLGGLGVLAVEISPYRNASWIMVLNFVILSIKDEFTEPLV